MSNLVELSIKNKNYSKLKEIKIFITPELKVELENIESERYGNLFKSLETVGFRGGKHLIEILKKECGMAKIILSHEKTEIRNEDVVINYNQYIKIGSKVFYDMYRQTGLKVASTFLKAYIPNYTPSVDETINKKEIEKFIDILPQATDRISYKKKNQLIDNFADIVRNLQVNKISQESLSELKVSVNQAFYRKRIEEFKQRLTRKYPETIGPNSWQSWIYNNSWMFGSQYIKPIQKKRVGFEQIPDYIFPTIDGFLDLLEIKTPEKKIIIEDTNHEGSFYWSKDVSEAIGQVINYIHNVEINRYQLVENLKRENGLDLSAIKPRAFIIIGKTEEWHSHELEALRKLNFALHGIEVISYHQLLKRGEHLIKIFDHI